MWGGEEEEQGRPSWWGWFGLWQSPSPPLESGEVCSITSSPKRVPGSLPGSQSQFGAGRNRGTPGNVLKPKRSEESSEDRSWVRRDEDFVAPLPLGLLLTGGWGRKQRKLPEERGWQRDLCVLQGGFEAQRRFLGSVPEIW